MNRTRPSSLFAPVLVALLVIAATAGAAQAQAQAQAQATACADEAGRASQRVLAQAWDMVAQRFYDPGYRGVDWPAALDRHLPRACAATTPRALADAVNAMLGELGASHTGYFIAEEPAYFQLVDIFLGGDRRGRVARLFPGGRVAYDGIGIFTREIAGRVFVSGVWEGQPAAQAGLLVGDEIVAVEGAPFAPVASFAGRAGQATVLRIRREAEGAAFSLAVTPRSIEPNQAFLDALRAGMRTIEHGGLKIGYLRPWSYARPQIQEAIVEALAAGPLKDADALILDLRDGWGGARADYLGLFQQDAPDVTYRGRDGRARFEAFRWRRPMAALINGGTRSGKELIAYALQQYGQARLVGTRSAGALLAGSGFLMDNDALLEIAVAEVKVDGQVLEGVGVAPDLEVPFDLPYAAGRDPQLEAALELLAGRGD